MRKYQHIQENLINQIEEGNYSIGEKLPAVRKLAKMFEVNTMTVHHAIKELADLHLVESRQGDGTYVLRRYPLKEKKTLQMTGEEILTFSSHSWEKMMNLHEGTYLTLFAATEEAATYGWKLNVEEFPPECNQLEFIKNVLSEKKPSGVLLLGLGPLQNTRTALKDCVELDIPVVSMNANCRSEQFGVSSVGIDCMEGGNLAAEYLLENGVENAAAIYFSEYSGGGQFMAVQGARATFLEAGITEANFSIYGNTRDCMQMSGYRAARDILENNPDCQGLVVAHELLAQGAIEYIKETGRTVGHDFFVAGGPLGVFYDMKNTFGQAYCTDAFWYSYVYENCGREAVKILAAINSGNDLVRRIRISPHCVAQKTILEREKNVKNNILFN